MGATSEDTIAGDDERVHELRGPRLNQWENQLRCRHYFYEAAHAHNYGQRIYGSIEELEKGR